MAAALLAVDPAGLGGVALRARAGPVRDRWLALLRCVLPAEAAWRRVPLGIGDERLLGGLDLAATLAAGRPVAERGLLAQAAGGVLLLAMAERLPAGTAARIGAELDRASLAAIALDEGAEADERTPAALLDRLAFHVELAPLSHRDIGAASADALSIAAARARLPQVTTDDEVLEALCSTALALGVASVRAPLLALRAARAAAALAGRTAVSQEDAALAARLVLAPRATVLPGADAAPEQDAAEPPPDDDTAQASPGPDDTPKDETPKDDTPEDDASPDGPLGELVLAAARAAIPSGLLARLAAQEGARARARTAGRVGQVQSGRRGRPAGVRAGSLVDGLRLSVADTLRAAAPWQRLRAAEDPDAPARLRIRGADIRIVRLKQRTETTTIFVVDASGSSALNRLAEAKGAVELLLAECYVRRDQVAVLAFRGRAAQLLLPPTRSLARAKRGLASLPGGGGTPLAAGIDAGAALADAVRRRGGTPSIVLLTDGRANVARDGAGGRIRAEADADLAARMVRASGVACLLVDTSPRPNPASQRLAAEMGARYVPLPAANAAALSAAVRLQP